MNPGIVIKESPHLKPGYVVAYDLDGCIVYYGEIARATAPIPMTDWAWAYFNKDDYERMRQAAV